MIHSIRELTKKNEMLTRVISILIKNHGENNKITLNLKDIEKNKEGGIATDVKNGKLIITHFDSNEELDSHDQEASDDDNEDEYETSKMSKEELAVLLRSLKKVAKIIVIKK